MRWYNSESAHAPVFMHGVANRPGPEQAAEIVHRGALYPSATEATYHDDIAIKKIRTRDDNFLKNEHI